MTTTLRWMLVTVLAGHGLSTFSEWPRASAGPTSPSSPHRSVSGRACSGCSLPPSSSLRRLPRRGSAQLVVGAGLGAAAVSQIAIATSWSDARAGTIVNLVLILVAGYGFAAEGPTSFHAQYRERAAQRTHRRRPLPADRRAKRTSRPAVAPGGLHPSLRCRSGSLGSTVSTPTSTAASAAARTRHGCRSPASRSTPTDQARSGSS